MAQAYKPQTDDGLCLFISALAANTYTYIGCILSNSNDEHTAKRSNPLPSTWLLFCDYPNNVMA